MKFLTIAALCAVIHAESIQPDDKKNRKKQKKTGYNHECHPGIKSAYYSDKECKNKVMSTEDDSKQLVFTADLEDAKMMNEKCHVITAEELKAGTEQLGDLKKVPESMRTDCDFENFKFQLWANDECKDEAFFTNTIPWNKCTKTGDKYVIMTGASALSATVAAAVAFAASQF